MLLSDRRRTVVVVMIAAIALLASWINPLPAQATNYTFSTTLTSGQPNESIGILAGSMCPSTGTKHEVYAVLTDSSNATFTTYLAETNTYGEWSAGMMPLENPELGVGELTLQCRRLGNVTQNYDSIPFEVTSPANTTITRNKQAHKWGDVDFQSVITCASNAAVTGKVYGNGQFTPLSDMSTTSDASGNWTLDFYVNPNIYMSHNVYYLRVSCGGTSYASYMFYVLDDEYVAMGDSYSSGEGAFNYNLAGGACHRSTDGYPHIVAEELSLGLPNFVACSGAVTADMFGSNPVKTAEDAQLNHLTFDTKVVTLTVGGNDMGFEDVMTQCVNGFGCSSDSTLISELNARRAALADGSGNIMTPTYNPDERLIWDLLNVYERIHEASPDAKIYIGGYPHLFGSDLSYYTSTAGNPPGGGACQVLGNLGVVSYTDAQWINGQADALNAVILDAVEDAQAQDIDIEFVPAALFSAHGLCDISSEWINAVQPGSEIGSTLPESFHPNADGYYYGYAQAFIAVMS